VIAMVAAGYEATLAPLGTALTEDQLALLWRMSDEPVLCFDGDKAGTRAAYRAIDLALPQLKPGKSLKFAILPEGQDPDDLFRSGGRAAIEDVIGAARPLSDLLWLRETEAGSFDTPERRAALERRIAEVVGAIGDEAVRRYYRQDLEARLQRLLAPPPAPDRGRGFDRDFSRRGKNRRSASRAEQPGFREISGPRSARFATSSIVRGIRTGLPAREALILLAVINHPWLLEAHAEELAEIELRHPDADRLRRAMLDTIGAAVHDGDTMRAALAALGLGGAVAQIEKAITHGSDWPARSGAAPEDVAAFWTHVLTLHRRTRTLHKELKSAEQALGSEPNEENFLWLRDVQERLATVEGTEALIEGFGAHSGRPARS
jgi:DNA primase